MCAIFGLLDPRENLSRKEKQRIIQALGWEAQIRGTDATGLAWVEKGHIGIRKAPCAARRFAFRFPGEAKILMGHTRMTTQGSEKQNQNNHPFPGKAGNTSFALAHNGVLHNDSALRRIHHLSGSRVQTDSYVAVQLLEEAGEISHTSLAAMAEELEGSFTFTILTWTGAVSSSSKGNNPLSLWYFTESGVYLYASTEEILTRQRPGGTPGEEGEGAHQPRPDPGDRQQRAADLGTVRRQPLEPRPVLAAELVSSLRRLGP